MSSTTASSTEEVVSSILSLRTTNDAFTSDSTGKLMATDSLVSSGGVFVKHAMLIIISNDNQSFDPVHV